MSNVYKSFNQTSGGSGGGSSTPYVESFNATTDWGAASGGLYSYVVVASSHGKGTDPVVQVYETIGTDDYLVDVSELEINSSGDVKISVTESIDTRFAGKIVIK